MSDSTPEILTNLNSSTREQLRDAFPNVAFNWNFSNDFQKIENGHLMSVIWIDMKIKVGMDLLSILPNLKFIVSPTTGVTHIDATAIRERGVELISLKGESKFLQTISASSEYAWTLMLSVWRKLPLFMRSSYVGIGERENFTSRQLSNRTIGIIGFGRIGRQLSVYANSFGMNVVFVDPYISKQKGALDLPERATPLKSVLELCQVSDVVMVAASHLEKDASSYPIIGHRELSFMKEDAVLVNIARGSLIDETSVAQFIRSGKLMGFATDVLSMEEVHSDVDSPLPSLADEGFNVIVSPHIGGMCADAYFLCQIQVAKKLIEKLGKSNEKPT